jgi:hypothetical protein
VDIHNYGLWNGRSVLYGQYQAALHDPDLDGCVDLEPGLVQPVAFKLDPWHRPSGPDGIVLELAGMTSLVFRRTPLWRSRIVSSHD